jgi:putative regulator of septum formation
VNDTTTEELRAAAGATLYRGNPFRVTALDTDADQATIRRRQLQLAPAIRAGAAIDVGADLSVRAEELNAAFERLLGHPQRRLVYELTWLWDTPASDCRCAPELHEEHDHAVEMHSAAIDTELAGEALNRRARRELDKLWTEAARLWDLVLRRNDFWDHPRHRIDTLGEKQFDESVLDVLDAGLPRMLVSPLIALAATIPGEQARLVEHARRWPDAADAVDELLEAEAAPMYESVSAALGVADGHLNDIEPRQAGSVITERAMPLLERLSAFVPPDRYARTKRVRNLAANHLCRAGELLIAHELSEDNAELGLRWMSEAIGLTWDEATLVEIHQRRESAETALWALERSRNQLAELLAYGRTDQALRMLHQARAAFPALPSFVREIDEQIEMVSTAEDTAADTAERVALTRRQPASAPPAEPEPDPQPEPEPELEPEPSTRPRPALERPASQRRVRFSPMCGLVVAVVASALALLILRWSTEKDTVTLAAEQVEDNAPAGTCLGSESSWRSSPDSVPATDCDQPHWGEVLGYPRLGPAPSPYPGTDQVRRLSAYECGRLLAQQELPANDYASVFDWPDEQRWNSGAGDFQNYATCVTHRSVAQPMPAGRRVRSEPPSDATRNLAVPMSLSAPDPARNAPVGSCVGSDRYQGGDQAKHPIIPCDQPRREEIIGYPELFPAGSSWPGDVATQQAADRACRQVASQRNVPTTAYISYTTPGQAWFDIPEQPIYTTCVAYHR